MNIFSAVHVLSNPHYSKLLNNDHSIYTGRALIELGSDGWLKTNLKGNLTSHFPGRFGQDGWPRWPTALWSQAGINGGGFGKRALQATLTCQRRPAAGWKSFVGRRPGATEIAHGLVLGRYGRYSSAGEQHGHMVRRFGNKEGGKEVKDVSNINTHIRKIMNALTHTWTALRTHSQRLTYTNDTVSFSWLYEAEYYMSSFISPDVCTEQWILALFSNRLECFHRKQQLRKSQQWFKTKTVSRLTKQAPGWNSTSSRVEFHWVGLRKDFP